MDVEFHRTFLKEYGKLPRKIQARFKERLDVFRKTPFDESLGNHTLAGKWAGCRSINVTGDYRAIFEETKENTFRFMAIGTHSKLYG